MLETGINITSTNPPSSQNVSVMAAQAVYQPSWTQLSFEEVEKKSPAPSNKSHVLIFYLLAP